jgi:hypothetical protein
VVAEDREALFAVSGRVRVRLVDPGRAPVGAAEGADAPGLRVLVQDVHELADRDLGVVPMHHVDVRAIGLLAVE